MALMYAPFTGLDERPADVPEVGHLPTYVRLMIVLMERSIEPWIDAAGTWHPKLTMEERGAQCYTWAQEYEAQDPVLAADLRLAARRFAEELYRLQEA
jgi:hypothetical protein